MTTLPFETPLGLSSSGRWRRILPAFIVVLGWILFVYRETAVAMVTIWSRSDTFTHGFLVPPIAIWLIWRKRESLARQYPRSAPGAWALMAVASLVWLLGDLVAVNAVTQLSLVALLVLAVPAMLGWSVTRLIVFPLGFLFFSVPIGEFLLPPLMEWTADVTVFALRLTGIPVYREGLDFVVPSGRWAVVEACSGVRYLIASLTVGALFAYLNYRSTQRRVLFVLVALVVPVIANWIRAYMIVMVGHLSGNTLAVGVDHLLYGWLFFGVVIMLMFMIGARWAEPEQLHPAGGVATTNEQVTATAIEPVGRFWVLAASVAALVSLPHLALLVIDSRDLAAPLAAGEPLVLVSRWQTAGQDNIHFKPAFINPSRQFNQRYKQDGSTVGVYLGYYQHQSYERKLVSSNNMLVAGKDPHWVHTGNGYQPLRWGQQVLQARTAELRRAPHEAHLRPQQLVALQFYWVGGRVTASDHLAKVYGAMNRLLGRGDGSAVIVVYAPKDQTGAAGDLLLSFLVAHQPAIHDLLLTMGTRP